MIGHSCTCVCMIDSRHIDYGMRRFCCDTAELKVLHLATAIYIKVGRISRAMALTNMARNSVS